MTLLHCSTHGSPWNRHKELAMPINIRHHSADKKSLNDGGMGWLPIDATNCFIIFPLIEVGLKNFKTYDKTSPGLKTNEIISNTPRNNPVSNMSN
jgi:hypothetical protein